MKLKNSMIKMRWDHKKIPKTKVAITELGVVSYEITLLQRSKREKRIGFQTVPKGVPEQLQIGKAKTLDAAERKAINWMLTHPNA